MTIKEVIYDGLRCVELLTNQVRMIVTLECGPRIAFWGKVEGENLLYWDKEGVIREDWKLYGGHRVWITRPYADESEDTYRPDNEACMYRRKENSIIVTAPMDPILKIVRGMEIEIVCPNKFRVTNFIKNESNMLYSGGVWSPTCTNPEGGKVYGIPLGDKEAMWDVIKIMIPRKFAGNTIAINDSQITYNEKYMLIKPMGKVAKRVVYAPMGKIAMTWPDKQLSFIKTTVCVKNGRYPLDGCNIAVFIGENNFMVEMETYSEEQTIVPGAILKNDEIWEIIDQVLTFNTYEELGV